MGSRAVVVLCRDAGAARARFGVANEGSGICYTRTGRRFFDDGALEAEFLARVRAALDAPLPPRWRRAAQTSAAQLELSPSELEELGEAFERLLDRYRGRGRRRGARSVIVAFQAAAEA
jgi:hypothetical protein